VDATVGLHLLAFDPQGPIVADGYDRSGDDHRALTYTSEPLGEPLSLRGAPEAVVHLSGDCAEFPLSVWLADVSPSGHSTLICQGWISAAGVAGEPLAAGRGYELPVALYSTAYRVAAGHRVRLGIAGSHFPLLWPAPARPTLEVERSRARPTRVSLPISPPNAPRPAGPDFGPPEAERGRDSIRRRRDRIVRELDDSLAAFGAQDDWTTALDDGAVLTLKMHNVSTITGADPVNTVLEAHLEALLKTPGDVVHITVESLQTHEAYTFKAKIHRNGTHFFSRVWTLPLEPQTYLPKR
jgi:hypothetical protein